MAPIPCPFRCLAAKVAVCCVSSEYCSTVDNLPFGVGKRIEGGVVPFDCLWMLLGF